MNHFRSLTHVTVAAFIGLACLGTAKAVTVPGCQAPTDADFTMTTLVTRSGGNLNEPLRMAFDMSASGVVDIYFVEKAGKLRKYDGATKAVSNIGTISVRTTGEHGLLGIALDPAFKTNKWIYLFYGSGSGTYEFRLSRFTMTGSTLDMGSEKIMMHIPADNNQWHTGGALLFDKKGDLWVTVGDNKSDEGGSPNTNSMLGKIMRIHPMDDGTYSIPDGNLFPKGTDKTKPEIYIMGNRNPYSITVDPVTGWPAWGEVGPDGFGPTEEFDIAPKPGNYGWPYFAGNNMVLKSGKVPSAPVNSSTLNTGLTNLPPAIPASYPYNQSCAITGPIYRYDATPNSPIKMPPHFDGIWFLTDFNTGGSMGGTIDTMSFDDKGAVKKFGRVFPKWKLASPTDFQVGPDGAFYVMNYAGYFTTVDATALVRIEYNGTCRPASGYTSIGPGLKQAAAGGFTIQGSLINVGSEGESRLLVRDMSGRTMLSRNVQGGSSFSLSGAFKARPGLYVVTLNSGSTTYSQKALLGAD